MSTFEVESCFGPVKPESIQFPHQEIAPAAGLAHPISKGVLLNLILLLKHSHMPLLYSKLLSLRSSLSYD